MPPKKKQGSLLAEDHLAERIELERKRLNMSYEGLAKRVTDAGCPIQPSAIHKIEKGSPRRRITVDEAIAYAEVFGIPIAELLAPPSLAGKQEFRDLWSRRRASWEELKRMQEDHRLLEAVLLANVDACNNRMGELFKADPELRASVGDLVAQDEGIHSSKRDDVTGGHLDLLDHYSDKPKIKNKGGAR